MALVDAPPLPLLLFENTSAPDEAVLVEAFPLVLNVDVGAVIDNDPVLFVALVGAVVVVVEEFSFMRFTNSLKLLKLYSSNSSLDILRNVKHSIGGNFSPVL